MYSFQRQQKDAAIRRYTTFMDAGAKIAARNEPLHIKACMLFWGEGSKRKNLFIFTNCEVETHRLMVQFINFYFPHLTAKIRALITFYPTVENPYEKVLNFWCDALNLKANQFTKPTDKSKYYSKPKTLKSTTGVLRISIGSTELTQHLFGAINHYIGTPLFKPENWNY